ncbi:MAG TPA: NADH-quinone oxidoreductase subunit L [Polyangia bacterium]|nr:NADH-quinone oxidoreductase subunit L [Polyangia bacterium]HVZ86653.1 NADH-quinone oxidoreductase subunit L [Polyangia bacterium]
MTFNLRLIPLLPFLGATILMLFGRKWSRDAVVALAAGVIAGACLVAFDAYFLALPDAGAAGLHDTIGTWIAAGPLHIDLAFKLDGLSGLLCLIITFIGFLIHVYSSGYMAHDPDYPRFFAYLNLFCGSMLVLVLGDSLPVMFIGWEGVGLCSYLLIGFWYKETPNADAGKKAFITNRIGDLGFLIGMFLLYQYTGTLNFSEISATAAGGGGALTQTLWLGAPVAFWAGLFLFIGATGKSAQIPLYVWLPDAMAGPTPVSALIHAATMVTAGVYMVARMHAVYILAPAAMAIITAIGALTALFAAIIGFAQNDFKKVLAYSTVSQLGFMFVGVGTGNFEGGIFHLYTHAFFKAGLFLCAGSVMHAMSGSGDITQMGGLRKKLPWTHAVFVVCWLAISGVVLFSGFFSKDAIIAGAMSTEYLGDWAWVGRAAGIVLSLAALGTAFYMSRLYFLVFSGETRASHEVQHHIHESPGSMVGPLVVLAIGAAVGGFVGLPGSLFEHTDWNLLDRALSPVLGAEMEIPHVTEYTVMIGATVLAAIGIGLAYVFYGGGYRAPARKFAETFPGLVRLAQDKFRVDELYQLLFIRPLKRLSQGIYFVVDRILIDKILVEGAAAVVDVFGRLSRAVQVGDGQRYMAVFALGVAGFLYFSTRPTTPDDLKVTVSGMQVDVDARRGGKTSERPLEYSFDFDDGAKVEAPGLGPTAHHTYSHPGTYTIRVDVKDPRWGTSAAVKQKVEVR